MRADTLGGLRLVRTVANDARGTVHEAVDPQDGRRWSVRVLPPPAAPGSHAPEYDRLRHAAAAAAELHHPNIVELREAGREGDAAFVVTEWVDGETLAQYLARVGRLPALQGLALALQLLSGLESAHARGLVHSAIQPRHLVVGRNGQLKIAGFGWVAAAAAAGRRPGVFDAPAYMAPEQILGRPADHRADLYSAAVVAYELLAGSWPHQAHAAPRPPRELRPELPAALDAVFERAQAQAPEARYASAAALAGALQKAFGTPVWERALVAAGPSRRAQGTEPRAKEPEPRVKEAALAPLSAARAQGIVSEPRAKEPGRTIVPEPGRTIVPEPDRTAALASRAMATGVARVPGPADGLANTRVPAPADGLASARVPAPDKAAASAHARRAPDRPCAQVPVDPEAGPAPGSWRRFGVAAAVGVVTAVVVGTTLVGFDRARAPAGPSQGRAATPAPAPMAIAPAPAAVAPAQPSPADPARTAAVPAGLTPAVSPAPPPVEPVSAAPAAEAPRRSGQHADPARPAVRAKTRVAESRPRPPIERPVEARPRVAVEPPAEPPRRETIAQPAEPRPREPAERPAAQRTADSTRPARTTAVLAGPAAPSPLNECRQEFSMARDLCVAYECASAEYRRHPVCVRMHADAVVRHKLNPRNGP